MTASQYFHILLLCFSFAMLHGIANCFIKDFKLYFIFFSDFLWNVLLKIKVY